jgi:hypothetical protein
MRETGANGHECVFMPKDVHSSIGKLATIGVSFAKRQWETAAIVAMICERGKAGRPKNGLTSQPNNKRLSVRELASKGIYGLQSRAAITAYLRAWDISGLPVPEPGMKVELPVDDFPDVPSLYGKLGGDEEAAEGSEGSGVEEPEDEDEEPADALRSGRKGPSGGGGQVLTVLDQFLKVLDRTDPTLIIHGQSNSQVQLLIKTLESWLESLRDAAGEAE